MHLPEVPSMCTNIQFSAMARTGNRPPPESRDWGRTWTAGREPEREKEDRFGEVTETVYENSGQRTKHGTHRVDGMG